MLQLFIVNLSTTTESSIPSCISPRRVHPTEHATPLFKMLVQLSRATRAASAVSRVAVRANAVQMRSFIAPTVSRRADFVQELYLKELKAYKPTPVKESDADGQVQVFSAPKAPASPEEADLASSLKEYETMAVEVEGQAPVDAAAAPKQTSWLVEEDEEAAAAH